MIGNVLAGDILKKSNELEDSFYQVIITSPPYYGLRSYSEEKNINEIGHEDNYREYIAKIVLNCTRSAYSKMEAGTRLISIDDLIKLADFYNVSLDYLVGRVDNKEDYYSKKY